ncbi:hypothetical protein [Candidatus Arthromitus sp. SFB-rat-Yit]|uniref:hypothetical protein n=1 Tax=Candidatus Arthromitus sp. SFB-rat-Yit TaxID=1041504 RepID=UPI000227A2EE|nr:hypothetical protein [Candidatus Arthromitus sp. SFB-rat-Yit]BAK80826.1 hypothetical protein RATSFB_0264 [Candidatus Arthromitus sp. SFB-rat-Yit]
MELSIDVLNSKLNFLYILVDGISKHINVNFDFFTFVINNNLTCTDIVLITKALTIMNYRRAGLLDKNIREFNGDDRLSGILVNKDPSFSEFDKFLLSINLNVNAKELLSSLINQKIGSNICEFLLEDGE